MQQNGVCAKEYVSVQGPVERRDNRFVLRIPLDAGGAQLRDVAQTTSFVEDDMLVVLLPEWLAERMHLLEGSEVYLDDRWGKLNIARVH